MSLNVDLPIFWSSFRFQVVHGRSKSFPELLDMKFESSAAVNPHSKLLAPESYQSKRMKGRDQHGFVY